MSLEELYYNIRERTPLEIHKIKPEQRIAVVLPDELDIMKILGKGYVDLEHQGRKLLFTAKICPDKSDRSKVGLASFRLTRNGSVYLNNLIEIFGLTPSTVHIKNNPLDLDFPGYKLEELDKEMGILREYRTKGYFIIANDATIVPVSREEMHYMQSHL